MHLKIPGANSPSCFSGCFLSNGVHKSSCLATQLNQFTFHSLTTASRGSWDPIIIVSSTLIELLDLGAMGSLHRILGECLNSKTRILFPIQE